MTARHNCPDHKDFRAIITKSAQERECESILREREQSEGYILNSLQLEVLLSGEEHDGDDGRAGDLQPTIPFG